MDADFLKHIRKLVILGMFSDDYLMNVLVLKGASALDIIYGLSERSSLDVDFSIEGSSSLEDIESIRNRIQRSLSKIFSDNGYRVFDLVLEEFGITGYPESDFWGGYKIKFKIIENEKYNSFISKEDKLRIHAIPVGRNNSTVFEVDISKSEYCEGKQEKELEGYKLYIYSPEMILAEKLRAICQQMPEYEAKQDHTKTARARDFFDIYCIAEEFEIDFSSQDFLELLKNIFSAKKVSLDLLKEIEKYREFHGEDFPSVKATVRPSAKIEEFDFYFDYVIKKVKELKAPGIV